MRIILCFLFLTQLAWAQDETLVDPMPHPSSEVNQCHDFEGLESLTGEQLAWMHCTPMALSIGISMGKGVLGAAAGQVVRRIAGRSAARVIMGLNIVGVGVTAFEIARLLAMGAAQARQCQLYEHDYKLMLMDAVDHRGQQFRETLESHGITLTDQQIRQLQYPPAYRERERLERTTCGDVTLMTSYMDERQNRVALDAIQQYQNQNGVLLSVAFPDPPRREISQSDQTLIQELSMLARCLPTAQKARIFCAIGNLGLLGRPIDPALRRLARQRRNGDNSPRGTRETVMSFEEIAQARQDYLRTQLFGNMRFPQTEQGIVGLSVAHLMRNPGRVHHLASPPSTEELDTLLRAATKTHAARGVDIDLNRGDLRGMFNTSRSVSFARMGQIHQVLARVSPRLRTVNGSRLSLDDNTTSSLHGMAGNIDRFVVGQTADGQRYLREIGDTIHESMTSPEMRALTTRWQASRSPNSPENMHEIEFTNQFRRILENSLTTRHPEMRGHLDQAFLQQLFPETNVTPGMARHNTAAGWIARLFSLEYR